MDYWKFMEHGLFGKGSARKNHKYYQRVEVGTDRNGNTEYALYRRGLEAQLHVGQGDGSAAKVPER